MNGPFLAKKSPDFERTSLCGQSLLFPIKFIQAHIPGRLLYKFTHIFLLFSTMMTFQSSSSKY